MSKRRYAYKTHFGAHAFGAHVACHSHFRKHRSLRPREATCGNCLKTIAWKKAALQARKNALPAIIDPAWLSRDR